MGFWDIIDKLSNSTQFPKKWNIVLNWAYLLQLIVAIGSCYINKKMWPIRNIEHSLAVLQIKGMLILQIVMFYWEIMFTRMISGDFNIVEHHIVMIVHSAFLLYYPDTVCGNTLLPYLFYSITWAFGKGNNRLFYLMYIANCFLYIFQTLYAYKLPKTLSIAYPIIAIYQTFSNYKYYCWSLDGTFCPNEKIIFFFGSSTFAYILTYVIIVSVIFSITVIPFYACLERIENNQIQNMTISDSIESNNTNKNSFKDK